MQQRFRSFFSSHLLPLAVLFAVWLAMQVFLLFYFGIETSFEAAKYIAEAKHLLEQGSFTSNNFFFYSTQILLIAACLTTGLGYIAVIALQLLINALSLWLFYRTLFLLTKSRPVAFSFSLLLTSMLFYQLYNVYLFTESLFFSFSICYTAILFSLRKPSGLALSGVAAALILLVFTRPTGLLFIPATILFLLFKFGGSRKKLFLVLFGMMALALFYLLVNTALSSGGEFDFLLPYVEEHIICGVATVTQQHSIKMPVGENSVEGLIYLFTHYTGLFLRLSGRRLLTFWSAIRPYYSTAHNLFLAAYFYSLYALLLWGVKSFFRFARPEAVFLLTYSGLVSLTVMLSCDEWHNRFLYSILPSLLFLAAGTFTPKQKRHRVN